MTTLSIKISIRNGSEVKIMDVPYLIFQQMKTLYTAFDTLYDIGTYDTNNVIDIADEAVKFKSLELIIDYYSRLLNVNNYQNLMNDLMDWEIEFFKSISAENSDVLTDLLNDVDYLEMNYMLNKGCNYIASFIIKEKTVEELRDYFKIENDFSAGEEQQIRDDFYWALTNE